MPPPQYVILAGNVIDGITVIGPFTDGDDAGDWACDQLNCEWISVEITPPPNYSPDY